MTKFIAIVGTAFFALVNPVSTSAKPTCMNITRNAASTTQARFSACSICVGVMSPLPMARCGALRLGATAAQPDERGEPRENERDDHVHQPAPRPGPAATGGAHRLG